GRDLDQVEALNFPCFTSGTICAHGYCHFPSVHVPVHVGGVTVHPGDLLHGDRNGVTTIPAEIASEVAGVCEEFVAAEALVLNYLRQGKVTLGGFTEARKACKDAIDRLAQRVSRKKTVSGG